MHDYPPLTPKELRQLYQQNPSRESRRLLWEIDRLHQSIAEVHYFLTRLHGENLPAELLVPYSQLLAGIEAEPGIRRQRGGRAVLLQPPAVLACSMVYALSDRLSAGKRSCVSGTAALAGRSDGNWRAAHARISYNPAKFEGQRKWRARGN